MPAKNKKYLEWIRQQKCVVTGSDYEVIAHHLTIDANRGFGQKPSDYWSVPLRAELHAKLHHIGERRFWGDCGILRPHLFAVHLIERYLMEKYPDVAPKLMLRAMDSLVNQLEIGEL